MENREILRQILQLPLRKWIITKYGTFQDFHKSMMLMYDESEYTRDLYKYILENYKEFKTKK
ncbi:hypothetical protein UFOVP104_42 [uncultured Caudovirales phage]|uniref:Uncharacterized protein n=1 Tax=uncultured Caudovirales phage TaxID=2100421 RepID=A0A6J5LHR4_9CAUD|nr:hypothetical protein UFOVP104_42 [uncultured Caudovirales phage]CAB4134144.1 hypothetical protein UFOVP271_22 [uncultured Caudovirales phage]